MFLTLIEEICCSDNCYFCNSAFNNLHEGIQGMMIWLKDNIIGYIAIYNIYHNIFKSPQNHFINALNWATISNTEICTKYQHNIVGITGILLLGGTGG